MSFFITIERCLLKEAETGWQLHTLDNGLRLIVIERAQSPTVAVRAYVRAGSRFDAIQGQERALPGLAHLTEHMLFQGTQKYSHSQLFSAVERYGGTLDAHTAKEYLVVSSVTPTEGLETALGVIAEILISPIFDEVRFWREKLVVLDEIRRAQDQQSILYSLFTELLWPDHPLSWPTYGTIPGLNNIAYSDILDFHRQRFVSGNALLVICGDVGHDDALAMSNRHFASLPIGSELSPLPDEILSHQAQRRTHLARNSNQLYLLFGVPTVGMKHPDRSALKLAERVLGMGGSARLYQSLRERAQLVYSVHTINTNYEDAGFFAVQAVCRPENYREVTDTIAAEWQQLAQRGVTSDELAIAKSNYAGTLARQFETNAALAGIYGVEALLSEVESPEQAVERINAVDAGDVLRVARQYLSPERYTIATSGPAEQIND